MIIRNGLVFDEDMRFRRHDVFIQNGMICSEEEYVKEDVIDAEGRYIIPGLIDIHSHGAVGEDVSDGNLKGLHSILTYEKAAGITSYCPTTMSLPKEKLLKLCTSFGQLQGAFMEGAGMGVSEMNAQQQSPKQSRLLGLHLEGPFLAGEKKGAHREDFLCLPDMDFFQECCKKSKNRIRLVTLAPEQKGATEFIGRFHDSLTISLGHTAAGYDTAILAMKAGAKHVTHLYNAMLPFAHREPGLVGAAMDTPDCMVELICDGVHVHESMVRAAFTLFPGRVVLVSDSMRATGLGDGIYELGGQQVKVRGRHATLSDGTIAGSVSNLMDCLQKAISFGIPKEEAVAAATANPAKSIGVYNKIGSITPGKYADLLLLDPDFKLVRVI